MSIARYSQDNKAEMKMARRPFTKKYASLRRNLGVMIMVLPSLRRFEGFVLWWIVITVISKPKWEKKNDQCTDGGAEDLGVRVLKRPTEDAEIGKVITDLAEMDKSICNTVAVRTWKYSFCHPKNPVCENGEPGQERELELELKVLQTLVWLGFLWKNQPSQCDFNKPKIGAIISLPSFQIWAWFDIRWIKQSQTFPDWLKAAWRVDWNPVPSVDRMHACHLACYWYVTRRTRPLMKIVQINKEFEPTRRWMYPLKIMDMPEESRNFERVQEEIMANHDDW